MRKRLNQELSELRAANEAILHAAETEKRDLTDEDKATMKANLERKDEILAQIALLDADRDAGWPGEQPKSNAANITNIHDNRADAPWKSMGEQMLAIARAASPHGERDPRLFAATPTGANASDPAAGGFLLHSEYSEALLDKAREEAPLLGMCREIPIADGVDSIDLPMIDETSRATGSRWGGVQVYRRAEAQAVTAKKPSFGLLKLEPAEIFGLAYATERLLRNAPTIERVFGDAFASEFGFKATDEIIRGTGGGDEMVGILSATALVTQAIESGQTLAADAVNTKNISNMWMHLPARSKPRAVWLINGELGPALDELSIPAGTAALEPRFVTYDANGVLRIKGRPVIELEQCSAPGTVGDIILADMSEYLLGTKGDVNAESSIHVQFIYSEMTYRWTYYISGKPAVLSAVTPYKGSASRSPFVTLNTRS